MVQRFLALHHPMIMMAWEKETRSGAQIVREMPKSGSAVTFSKTKGNGSLRSLSYMDEDKMKKMRHS